MAINKTRIREEARSYFIPFLLGDNEVSHKLSRRIYKKIRHRLLYHRFKNVPRGFLGFFKQIFKVP